MKQVSSQSMIPVSSQRRRWNEYNVQQIVAEMETIGAPFFSFLLFPWNGFGEGMEIDLRERERRGTGVRNERGQETS